MQQLKILIPITLLSLTLQAPANCETTEWQPYSEDLNRRVFRAWFPPKGRGSDFAEVLFTINSNGTISNSRISKSTKFAISDLAALKAIQNAAPFRPLPNGAPLAVNFGIEFKDGLLVVKRFDGIRVVQRVTTAMTYKNSKNLQQGLFSIGSHMGSVLRIQGRPLKMTSCGGGKNVWTYGQSTVTFTNGRVSEFKDLGNLLVKPGK